MLHRIFIWFLISAEKNVYVSSYKYEHRKSEKASSYFSQAIFKGHNTASGMLFRFISDTVCVCARDTIHFSMECHLHQDAG